MVKDIRDKYVDASVQNRPMFMIMLGMTEDAKSY